MDGKFTLEGIRRGVVNALNRKMHAENGIHFLTAAGTSPDGNYYAFEAGSAGVVISSIDYGEYANYYSGTLTSFPLLAGQTYFIKFKNITITDGALILYKEA